MLCSVGKKITGQDTNRSKETIGYPCNNIGFLESNDNMVSHMVVSHGIPFQIMGISSLYLALRSYYISAFSNVLGDSPTLPLITDIGCVIL